MTLPLIHGLEYLLPHNTTAAGLLYNDWDAVSPYQAKCAERLSNIIQLEEEAYIIKHPEILALLKVLVCRLVQKEKVMNVISEAAQYLVRPLDLLEKDVREFLKSPPEGPYTPEELRKCGFETSNLQSDLEHIILEFFPLLAEKVPTPEPQTPDTCSSSFMSVLSSGTTVPTPEPTPPPEPTLSEVLFKMVENCLDKATFAKVTDELVKYDTAYVEVMKMVEEVMEIPVIEIRADIAELLANAYAAFDNILEERAQIAAEIAWDRRMRKKLKRTIRRQDNFKGYETPPTPKSGLPSSHASYRVPPPRPCKCHPQWTYNRYPKDRFGIYLPREEQYEFTSITATPALSEDASEEAVNVE